MYTHSTAVVAVVVSWVYTHGGWGWGLVEGGGDGGDGGRGCTPTGGRGGFRVEVMVEVMVAAMVLLIMFRSLCAGSLLLSISSGRAAARSLSMFWVHSSTCMHGSKARSKQQQDSYR